MKTPHSKDKLGPSKADTITMLLWGKKIVQRTIVSPISLRRLRIHCMKTIRNIVVKNH